MSDFKDNDSTAEVNTILESVSSDTVESGSSPIAEFIANVNADPHTAITPTPDAPDEAAPHTLWGEARLYGEIDPAILDRVVTVAIGDKPDQREGWNNATGTIKSLIDARFAYHREGVKKGWSILQGQNSGGRRIADAMVGLDFLFIDVDNGMSRDEICERLADAGLFAIVYSTYSSGGDTTAIKIETVQQWLKKQDKAYQKAKVTLEQAKAYLLQEKRFEPRVLVDAVIDREGMDEGVGWSVFVKHEPIDKTRAILLLSETFKINERGVSPKAGQDEWSARYKTVCEKLAIPYDTSCRDVSRLFYLPRHPMGSEDHRIVILSGKTLDLMAYEPDDSERVFAEVGEGLGAKRGSGVKIEVDVDRVLLAHAKGLRFADLYREFTTHTHLGDGGMVSGTCPFDADHSNAGEEDYGFYCKNGDGDQGYVAGCMHDSCKRNHNNDRLAFARKFCADNGISAEDLRQWVELEGEEKWCLDAPEVKDATGEAVKSYSADGAGVEAAEDDIAGCADDPDAANKLMWRIGASGFTPERKTDLRKKLAKRTGCSLQDLMSTQKKAEAAATIEERLAKEDQTGFIKMDGYPEPVIKEFKRINTFAKKIRVGKSAMILIEDPRGKGYRPTLIYPTAFVAEDSAKKVCLPYGDNDIVPVRSAWMSSWEGAEQRLGLAFEPAGSRRLPLHPSIENIWRDFPDVQPEFKGKPVHWDPLREFLLSDICSGRQDWFDWVMTFMAHIWQVPGQLPAATVGLWSAEGGTGKNIMWGMIRDALGPLARVAPSVKEIFGNFNAASEGKLAVICDETMTGDGKNADMYKSLVTLDEKNIEQKGVDSVAMSNYERILQTSNNSNAFHVADAIDRRTTVLEVGSKDNVHLNNHVYFKSILQHMRECGGLRAMVEELKAWCPEDHGLSWDSLRVALDTNAKRQQAQAHHSFYDYFFLTLVEYGAVVAKRKVTGMDGKIEEEDVSLYLNAASHCPNAWPVHEVEQAFDSYIIGALGQSGIKRQGHKNLLTVLAEKYLLGKRKKTNPYGNKSAGRIWCWAVPSWDELKEHHRTHGWLTEVDEEEEEDESPPTTTPAPGERKRKLKF